MEKIQFTDASKTQNAKVIIDDVEYDVNDPAYEGGTDLNADTFNNMQQNIENAINGTILYDNEDGTIDDITLSESAENFEIIEIFTKSASDTYNSIKVFNPNGKTLGLSVFATNSTGSSAVMWIRYATINGLNVTTANNRYSRLVLSSSGINYEYGSKESDCLKITKIIGYR